MAVVTRAQAASNKGVKREKDNRRHTKAPDRHESHCFGLIQERLQNNLYHLLVQAILWNQTRGKEAKPVLFALLARYPDPVHLANADEEQLSALLYPIGLYRQRAKRLIALGNAMQRDPPTENRLFPARDRTYVRGPDADSVGWEVAHLPGVGPYALDSFRIFYRDQLRGLSNGWRATDDAAYEPEWKRVVPSDKDLRAFLRWAWQGEGYAWDPLTGTKTVIQKT